MAGKGKPGRRPKVPDGEILAILDRAGDPVVTTAEVAAELPIGKRATIERLKSLYEEGELDRKTVGARGHVWWRPIDTDGEPVFSDDPFLTSPTFESGESDVSTRVDAELAAATSDEYQSD